MMRLHACCTPNGFVKRIIIVVGEFQCIIILIRKQKISRVCLDWRDVQVLRAVQRITCRHRNQINAQQLWRTLAELCAAHWRVRLLLGRVTVESRDTEWVQDVLHYAEIHFAECVQRMQHAVCKRCKITAYRQHAAVMALRKILQACLPVCNLPAAFCMHW